MTRNEWIADEFKHRLRSDKVWTSYGEPQYEAVVKDICKAADALEAANVAPWQTEQAKDDGEAVALLREVVDWHDVQTTRAFSEIAADARAFLSRLDGKGGAK